MSKKSELQISIEKLNEKRKEVEKLDTRIKELKNELEKESITEKIL